MSTLDLYRLTQPELLSEHELCQILENSCIDITNFKKLSKIELLEIYKRVAMPLPQRQHGNKRNEENKNNMTGNSRPQDYDENLILQNLISNESDNTRSTNLCEKRKRVLQANLTLLPKSPIDESKSVSKKIRLSTTSKVATDSNGITKHKINEKNEDFTLTSIKKRQKITWP